MVVSLPKAVLRLTFAIYLVNYAYIRYDFFTSRVPFGLDIHSVVSAKETIFTIFLLILYAYC